MDKAFLCVSVSLWLFLLCVSVAPWHRVRLGDRSERPIEPQRTTKAVGSGGWSCHGEPLLVDLVRFRGVDVNISVTIVSARFFQRDALMPAVHAAHWVGLDRKREVLVHAHFGPPDARTIGIGARERRDALHL